MLDPQYLLGDEEMQQFIAEGCLTLKSSLPASLHQAIYQRTEEVFAKEGNPRQQHPAPHPGVATSL